MSHSLFQGADCWEHHRASSGSSDYIDVETPRAAEKVRSPESRPQPQLLFAPASYGQAAASCTAAVPTTACRATATAAAAAPRPTSGPQFLLRGSASGPRLAGLPRTAAAASPALLTPASLAPFSCLPPIRTSKPLPLPQPATASDSPHAPDASDSSSPYSAMLGLSSGQPALTASCWGAFDSFDFGSPFGDRWQDSRFEETPSATARILAGGDEGCCDDPPLLLCVEEEAAGGGDSPASSQHTDAHHSSSPQAEDCPHQRHPLPRHTDDSDSAGTHSQEGEPLGKGPFWEHSGWAAGGGGPGWGPDDGGGGGADGGEGSEEGVEDKDYDPVLEEDGGLQLVTGQKRVNITVGGGGCGFTTGACRNCGVSQTPQWRCGPEGKRTLCNACGMRYRKGLPLPYWEEAKKQRRVAARRV